MRQISFLKHAGVYAAGDFLVMAAGFVLLPLYTRCLTLAEFGTLEMLDRISEVAGICLIARGIPLAVVALYRQSDSDAERRRVVGAALLLAGSALIGGAAALGVLVGPLAGRLQLDSAALLWAAAVTALLDGVFVVALAANQARLNSVFYVTVSFHQFLAKLGLCILLVAGLGWGVWGVIIASLVRSLLFGAIVVIHEYRCGLAWPGRKMLAEMLAFALPFIPTGLCFFVLNSADRFFLNGAVSREEVGVYGLAYRLGMLVGTISLTPLFRVWSARMHDVARSAAAGAVFARTTTYLLGCYLFVGLGLCVLQDELLAVFAGNKFAAARQLIPLLVLAYAFQGASVLLDGAFYVRRRTGLKFGTALASTIVMLALYATLIPAYGTAGAALATLAGFVFHAALTAAVAQRVFPVPYEWGRLAALLGLAGCVWAVSQGLDSGWSMVPFKISLWLLWPTLLWASGVITLDEKERVLTQFAAAVRGCRAVWAPPWGRRSTAGRDMVPDTAEGQSHE